MLKLGFVLWVAVSGALSGSVWALEAPVSAVSRLETDDFLTIETKVQEIGARHGPAQVLVVSDIDHTVLAMTQDLGSDGWFLWQMDLVKKGAGPGSVGKTASEVFDAYQLIAQLARMRATQPEAPQVFSRLKKAGYPVIFLTSRSSSLRDVTERELERNGYLPMNTAIGPEKGYPGTYLPYVTGRPAESGLTADEVRKWKLSAAEPVSYMNGLYLTAGQNKGVMLRTLLHKTGVAPKAVVFVDDLVKHTDRMHEAFEGSGIEVVTFRYSREDASVKRFERGSKAEVQQKWIRYRSMIRQIFEY